MYAEGTKFSWKGWNLYFGHECGHVTENDLEMTHFGCAGCNRLDTDWYRFVGRKRWFIGGFNLHPDPSTRYNISDMLEPV